MVRISRLIALGVMATFISAGMASPSLADDLKALAGKWATSPENCAKLKNDTFKTTSEKSGNVMEVTGDRLTWTRGECALSDIKTAGGTTTAKGQCEQRGNEATGPVTLKHNSRNSIQVDTGQIGYSGLFVRCQ